MRRQLPTALAAAFAGLAVLVARGAFPRLAGYSIRPLIPGHTPSACAASRLYALVPFLPGVPSRKPPGANFYPEDMTRDEFETWAKALPEKDRVEARGFFTVIRRDRAPKSLKMIPYSVAYRTDLGHGAQLLRDAAPLTRHSSLTHSL